MTYEKTDRPTYRPSNGPTDGWTDFQKCKDISNDKDLKRNLNNLSVLIHRWVVLASFSAARYNVNSTYSIAVLLPLKLLGFRSLSAEID